MNSNIIGDISKNLSNYDQSIHTSADVTENINQILSSLPYHSSSLLTNILPPNFSLLTGMTGKYNLGIPKDQESHYFELQKKYPMLSTSAIAMTALAQVMQDSLSAVMNEINIQSLKLDTMRKQVRDTNNSISMQTEKMAEESQNRAGQISSGINKSTTDVASAWFKIFGIIAQLVLLIVCLFGAFQTGGLSLVLFLTIDGIASSIINAISKGPSLETRRNCSIALTFFSLNIFSESNDISLELGNINQETHDKKSDVFMWTDIAFNLAIVAFSIGVGIYALKSAGASVGSIMENGGNFLVSVSGLINAGLTIANGIFSIQQGKLHEKIAEEKFKLSSLQATVTWIKEALKDDNDYLSHLIKMFSQRANEVGNAWKQASDVMKVELEGKTQIARNI